MPDSTLAGVVGLLRERVQAKRGWCPHTPYPAQRAFLNCEAREVLYGGAAGGGKSDAILMAALEYADVPGYSALILRRDFQRLALPGAIMDRSKEWLSNTRARWNEQYRRWTFPSGATLQFGYVDSPDDRFRYASAEFQFIGFDELTEFRLAEDESNPYTFLFSRLRRTQGLNVPLRFRAASNPGNIGHAWVKRRFITTESATAVERGITGVFPAADGRYFVPAAIRDNPAINADEYEANLGHLPPVMRARLMRGNWDAVESLIFQAEWLRRYRSRGDLLDGGPASQVHTAQCRRFATVDTAGTSKDLADAQKGKAPSWSVCAVWDYSAKVDCLFLRHVWRERVGWVGLCAGVLATLRNWNVTRVRIENAHVGPALRDQLAASGFAGNVELVSPAVKSQRDKGAGAKLDRAIASGLVKRVESGRLLIPESAPWLPDWEMEVTSWGGLPDEQADQIDTASYACVEVGGPARGGGSIEIISKGGLRR